MKYFYPKPKGRQRTLPRIDIVHQYPRFARVIPFFIIIVCLNISNVMGQKANDKSMILQKTNVNKLNLLKKQYATRSLEKRKEAEQLAAKFGWEIRKFDANGNFMELQEVSPFGKPKYYITNTIKPFNLGAANTTKASSLWTGGSLGLNLNGESMTVGEWDGGAVRLTHQEFDANDVQSDGAIAISNHATHVGGTLVGLGTNATAKGMASQATLAAHDWNSDEVEMADEAATGLLISNHSYGWNPLFLDTWEFGYYDTQAESWDDIQYNAPFYLVVKSAGNDRDVYNTSKGGYDLVNGASAAKNTLVVAAVEEITNYTQPSDVIMSSFSSWGPTDDGRIKPDISAKGVAVFSSNGTGDSDYTIFSGTSMAAPNTTGSLLLLQQHYNNLNAVFMKASTLKAVAINTAEEAGDTPGPDYEFGWGLLNVEKAALLITNKDVSNIIKEETLNDNDSYTTIVTSDGTTPLKASLVWTDLAGTPGPANTVDNPLPMLVNDLDIRITKDVETHEPWVLDPANPSNGATTGDNVVDNVEGITIDFPGAGDYTITVTHKGSLISGSQDFSLVVNGVTSGPPPVCVAIIPDGLIPTNITDSSATISWNAVALIDSYDYRYRVVGTTTWTVVNSVGITADLIALNADTNYEFQLRSNCTDASSAYSTSANFTTAPVPPPCVVTTPTGLSVTGITSTSADVSWDMVTEATSYNYRYRPTGTTTWTNTNTIETTAVITGLSDDTAYEVEVNAECPDQISAYSGAVLFTTLPIVTLQPCNISPQNLSAAVTENSATVTWDAVENINFYEYIYREVGGTWINGTVTINELILTGLTALTDYELRIRSSCTSQTSPVGTLTWTTTDSGGPTCAVPDGLSATGITTSEATISWDVVTGGLSYNYRYRINGTISWTDANSVATFAAITGLDEGTTYEYQVQTVCDTENSAFSISSTFTTDTVTPTCAVPSGLIASGITTNAATLSWDVVTDAISYNYRYRVDGTTTWTDGNSIGNSVSLSGLIENTLYEYQLQTVCAGDNSAFSPSSTFATDPFGGGDPTSCDVTPEGLTAIPTGTTADISWSPVIGVIEYQYRYRPVSGGSWIGGTSTTNAVSLTNLNANTSYTFDMRAFCGGFSPIANVIFSTLAASRTQTSNLSITEKNHIQNHGTILYPNPVIDKLNIAIEFEDEARIIVYDVKGIKLIDKEINSNNSEINVASLKFGLYFVRIITTSKSITKQFIKR